jgi:hypothetical protein
VVAETNPKKENKVTAKQQNTPSAADTMGVVLPWLLT